MNSFSLPLAQVNGSIADFTIIDYNQLLEISSDRAMKPYSLDLRKKIIETYEQETISQRKLAQRFRIATSVVTRLLKQYRETGQLEAKPQPGRPKTLKPEHFQVVQELVSAQPDITLAELCQALNDHVGIRVSEPTMCRVMKHLNLTRKKKSPSSQREGN